MPVKFTAIQTRPNTNVNWFNDYEIGETGKAFKHHPDLIDFTEEVSADGLTMTRQFVMPDGWSPENERNNRIDYERKQAAYIQQHGIQMSFNIENI